MEILKAHKEKHLNTIVNFQIEMALESENLKLNPQTVLKGVEEILNDPSKGNYFICQNDEQIMACLLVQNEWSDWRNGRVLWIHSVYVLPKFRKKGIFKKMYEEIKDLMKNDQTILGIRLYVDKNNIPAQKVYDKLDMKNDHYLLYEQMK